jgi:hypothetical protein
LIGFINLWTERLNKRKKNVRESSLKGIGNYCMAHKLIRLNSYRVLYYSKLKHLWIALILWKLRNLNLFQDILLELLIRLKVHLIIPNFLWVSRKKIHIVECLPRARRLRRSIQEWKMSIKNDPKIIFIKLQYFKY